MERIKAPKELQRIVKRKQNKASDIVGELKKLGHGEALRLSVKEDFSGRSPRAIYQSLWRAGRRQGVRIAFLHDEKKDRIILARVDAK
ncbi:MAG: hypothetical protein KGM47_03730 [Acidobacteriota bacterium]|nr:hypothetical protein [Acidobacteriota bacterium]